MVPSRVCESDSNDGHENEREHESQLPQKNLQILLRHTHL
ncbi:hypothetical protein Pint_33823 [Pistacia integerrima]|uniref:Uncharacterized protein n=1 Tax=Pistacia integerrima TaxID=434235 RepID=A0ACC0X708_9ROSI|nr:hypothetical protein Pint_33823 [Pistacia integerrima]KAJ0076545.1 hypothetical protein Patl1_35382 [Pistacia atlantica]